jgi:hypothetical protein
MTPVGINGQPVPEPPGHLACREPPEVFLPLILAVNRHKASKI